MNLWEIGSRRPESTGASPGDLTSLSAPRWSCEGGVCAGWGGSCWALQEHAVGRPSASLAALALAEQQPDTSARPRAPQQLAAPRQQQQPSCLTAQAAAPWAARWAGWHAQAVPQAGCAATATAASQANDFPTIPPRVYISLEITNLPGCADRAIYRRVSRADVKGKLFVFHGTSYND